MSTIDEKPTVNTADVTPTETFPFEADARTKIAVLRAMAADFTQPAPRSLTPAERSLVSATSREFVEKSVNFGHTAPSISAASNADIADMNESEAYTRAYNAFIDEIESLRQTVRKAVALRRLKTVRAARSIYRMAKSYVLTEGGDSAKTHVQEMKKALRRRRQPAAETPQTPQTPPVKPPVQ